MTQETGNIMTMERAKALLYRSKRLMRTDFWFPHVPIALIVMAGGLLLLQHTLGQNWSAFYRDATSGEIVVAPKLLPLVLIGGGLSLVGLGLLFRARLAWVMALLLVTAAAISTVLGRNVIQYPLLAYFSATLVFLLTAWRSFDRTSIAGSTLFALTAIAMLLFYGTFGSFYLGNQFKPPITDLIAALYFAVVTMTTVGFGDITPATSETRLFTISVIIVGVAIFATSLTAVIAPLVSNSINRITSRKDRHMKRHQHFIVIGGTALAVNTAQELIKRGRAVTRILKQMPDDGTAERFDVVIGDASNLAVLREAGVADAECVLAMKADDSENAFIVLAVKELGDHVQTVVAVNDANHMDRIRLVQPDVIIAPEVFGAELIAMVLSGETISPDFLMERIFRKGMGKV